MKITQENITNCNNNIFGSWINDPDKLSPLFNNAEPFEHIIINNFLKDEIANKISNEFPENLDNYHKYNNPLEIKYAYDNISYMSDDIKNVFYALCSDKIIETIKKNYIK